MQLAWLVVLLAGLGVNGGALGLVTGTFAGDMTTVHVRYEAVVTPQEPGPIEVILPAMSRPLGVRVVPGDAIAERVETEHGMGWRITSEGPVHLETSMKKRIDADDLVAYHPTMTTSNESNPAWDPDKEYWIYVGGAAPVNVTMRMDVGDPCGTYQNRLNTTASHGWYTYQGQFAHPHGDLCFSPLEMVLLVLTFPFVGLSFMLAPLGAVFLMGLPAVTVAEAWLKLCPASSR